jgi:hypothetical protein
MNYKLPAVDHNNLKALRLQVTVSRDTFTMLFTKISVVLSVIAAATIYVAGFPFQETNAQRMARGLPPSPPKFGRQLPGKVNLDPRAPTPASASSSIFL